MYIIFNIARTVPQCIGQYIRSNLTIFLLSRSTIIHHFVNGRKRTEILIPLNVFFSRRFFFTRARVVRMIRSLNSRWGALLVSCFTDAARRWRQPRELSSVLRLCPISSVAAQSHRTGEQCTPTGIVFRRRRHAAFFVQKNVCCRTGRALASRPSTASQ